MLIKLAMCGIVIAVCVLRIAGATSPAFQAVAHLLVGGLLGAGMLARWLLSLASEALKLDPNGGFGTIMLDAFVVTLSRWRRFLFSLAGVASVVEIVVFVTK